MEELDRVGARVVLAGSFGSFAGVGTALYKGHPIPRTAGLTALSCAMSAMACFGSERVISMAAGRFLGVDVSRTNWESTIATHALGGATGGALLGALYLGRPTRGALFFVPIMTLVGLGESMFEDFKIDVQNREAKRKREAQ